MESRTVAAIYESRLLRRNPLLAALMGLSFEAEQALVTRAAEASLSSVVLDLACGPGIYARRFARGSPQGHVVGVDLSAAMLEVARQRARAERLDNLFLVRADALRLPLRDAAFDVVNCCGALHLFRDLPAALAEVARVLRPGGRFTAAAFRRRPGGLAARAARLRRRLFGLEAFLPEDLASLLRDAGLVDVRFPHVAGIWLVVSASKTGIT